MRIGDKIRFINDIGGGTVRKFPSDDRFVVVTDDNGFDIPVLKTDCVVVKPGISYGKLTAATKQQQIKNGEKKPSKQTNTNRLSAKGKQILEVDLHIEKLRPTDQSIVKGTALEYQLATARHILNSNKNRKDTGIVFIHGQGAGVLRKALIKEIEEHFPGFTWQDASFAKYGAGGAILVE